MFLQQRSFWRSANACNVLYRNVCFERYRQNDIICLMWIMLFFIPPTIGRKKIVRFIFTYSKHPCHRQHGVSAYCSCNILFDITLKLFLICTREKYMFYHDFFLLLFSINTFEWIKNSLVIIFFVYTIYTSNFMIKRLIELIIVIIAFELKTKIHYFAKVIKVTDFFSFFFNIRYLHRNVLIQCRYYL